MTTTTHDDPMQAAMEAEARTGPKTYFGQVQTDVWFCVLEKGRGKVVFDPAVHRDDQRCTAITMKLTPLNPQYRTMERGLIAESQEWTKVVKPSLVARSTDLRTINGQWAQIQMVPFGGTYTNAAGETRDRTAWMFVGIYPTEEACVAAQDAFWSERRGGVATDTPAPTGPSPEKLTAQKFLPALWAQSKRDVTKFAALLAGNPLTSKYFTLESPEVLALLGDEAPF